MKRVLAVILLFCMVGMGNYVYAEDFDLSGLTFDELVRLKERIDLAIWECEEWQEVTVPHGVWRVGEDIPAGTWTIRCADVGRDSLMMKECDIEWGEYLDDDGHSIRWKGNYDLVSVYNPNNRHYTEGRITEYTVTLNVGDYVIIKDAYNMAVFTPYIGKPSLGFK